MYIMYISRRSSQLILTICTAILFLSGCEYNTIGETGGENPQTLNQAKKLWEARELQNYTVEVEQHCFCGGPVNYAMTVRSGEVEEVINLNTGEKQDRLEAYRTIDEWFEWLEQVAAKDPVKLDLEFDPQYGYPTFVDYDQSLQIADEELQLNFQNLQRL